MRDALFTIFTYNWLPVYRWSVNDKQVTSTPHPIPGNWGGGGGVGYLHNSVFTLLGNLPVHILF